MIQTLIKNWWLVVFCGVLEAIVSVQYWMMHDQSGPLTFSTWKGTVELMGRLIMAAGACAIAAGIWRAGKAKCWLLVLHGLALASLGLIYNNLLRYRIRFLTVALLIVAMGVSMGILQLLIARVLRRQGDILGEWLLGSTGAASVAFALVFVALGFRWIRIEPGSHLDLLWLGSYFGFSAICMLCLALSLRLKAPGQRFVPFREPRMVH